MFSSPSYSFNVKETEAEGQTLFTGIDLTDADSGRNAEIQLLCTEESSPDACDTFQVFASKLEDGKYLGRFYKSNKIEIQ